MQTNIQRKDETAGKTYYDDYSEILQVLLTIVDNTKPTTFTATEYKTTQNSKGKSVRIRG
jgi:hypothetical protein